MTQTESLQANTFPPSRFIQDANEISGLAVGSIVYDIGSGVGRNALYLASLGFDVTGINNNQQEIDIANELAAQKELSGICRFILGDAEDPDLFKNRKLADVILVNEILHNFTKTSGHALLGRAKSATKIGGINVVTGYVVEKGHDDLQKKFLNPDELGNEYESGWHVLRYNVDPVRVEELDEQLIISSLAGIVARREGLYVDI